MRYLVTSVLLFLGCAHVERAPLTRLEAMGDEEVARMAVADTLGEQAVDPLERHDFERRVDRLVRQVSPAQGPLMHLLYVRCERSRARWILVKPLPRTVCEYAEPGLTLHTLSRKPMLQQAYLEALLQAVPSEAFAAEVRAKQARNAAPAGPVLSHSR